MSAKLFAGDTFPSRLTYKVAGQPVDITDYQFTLKIGYDEETLAKAAVILDQTTNKGQFEIQWAGGDLVEGNWPAQMLTIYPDGTERTDQLDALRIVRRL